MRLRVIATLAVLVTAVGVLAAGVGSAAASTNGNSNWNYAADPQNTNIPWLAWAGETVRVSRCFFLGDSDVSEAAYQSSDAFDGLKIYGEFDKADWSGATDQPPFFITNNGNGDETSAQVDPEFAANGGICFSTDVDSEKAGLERIKFSVSVNLDKWLREIGLKLQDQILFQQDLYVIWMWDSAPTLTEASDTGAYAVGDPGGSGSFSPIADSTGHKSFEPGLIKATVTGTFPMGNDYAAYNFGPSANGPGTLLDNGTITLPNDWQWLADHFAEDYSVGSTYPGATPMRWDIHDDEAQTEGHVSSSGCTSNVDSTLTVDAVDNCNGSMGGDPDLGPFSSIFGLVGDDSFGAMGPFDPIRAEDTLLSDGQLNADDAPMPALRVDVSLTNAGQDHSVGTLSKADKTLIFNRNSAAYWGNSTNLNDPTKNQHLLYAPFYKALVPAVPPIINLDSLSGVDGTIGGNFSNWLTSGAYDVPTTEDDSYIYDYWDTFTLDHSGGPNGCKDVLGNWISQPDGNTSVGVYTDEHGEAYVQFNPANIGAEDYYDHSTSNDGEGIYLTADADGRCDVYTGSLTGTAMIQAESVYPAESPTDPSNAGSPKLSNTLTKTVKFAPLKVLNCIPKGVNEAYCVETVTDFEGNPVAANVEFTAEGSSGMTLKPDPHAFGGYDPSLQVTTYQDANHTIADITTSPATGEAAVTVDSSNNTCVDVHAENLGTENPSGTDGIYRDFDINPTTGKSCGPNNGQGPIGDSGNPSNPPAPPTPPTTTPPTSTPGSSPSSSSSSTAVNNAAPVSVTAPAPTVATPKAAPTTTKKAAKVTLVSAHVVSTKAGRYLTVRVNSTAKYATLRITLIGKKGAKHIVLRKVATNHVVRVGNLKLAPSVKTVRVAVV